MAQTEDEKDEGPRVGSSPAPSGGRKPDDDKQPAGVGGDPKDVGKIPERPTGEGALPRLRAEFARRPALFAAGAFVLGILIAGVVGLAVVSAKNSNIDNLEDELTAEQQARAAAESERDDAVATADQITGRRDQIISDAKSRGQEMIDNAKQELSGLQDKIQGAQSDLSETESKLSDVQASLDTAQEQKMMSSFGDGTWQANVDYLPGTYSAPGGSGCYWEKLNGPSGGGLNNIIENGGFNKNQIVSVDSPYFSTDGCGTWTRTGD